MNYLKALLSLKGGSGTSLIIAVLLAKYFGISFEDAGLLVGEVGEIVDGGWQSALAFIAGLLIEKAKREKDAE